MVQSHLEMPPSSSSEPRGVGVRGAHGAQDGYSQVLCLGKDTVPGISSGMQGDHKVPGATAWVFKLSSFKELQK